MAVFVNPVSLRKLMEGETNRDAKSTTKNGWGERVGNRRSTRRNPLVIQRPNGLQTLFCNHQTVQFVWRAHRYTGQSSYGHQDGHQSQ